MLCVLKKIRWKLNKQGIKKEVTGLNYYLQQMGI